MDRKLVTTPGCVIGGNLRGASPVGGTAIAGRVCRVGTQCWYQKVMPCSPAIVWRLRATVVFPAPSGPTRAMNIVTSRSDEVSRRSK